MVGIIIAIIATLVIAVPVSAYVANTRSKKAMEITIGNAEDKAREIIDEAIKAAERTVINSQRKEHRYRESSVAGTAGKTSTGTGKNFWVDL